MNQKHELGKYEVVFIQRKSPDLCGILAFDVFNDDLLTDDGEPECSEATGVQITAGSSGAQLTP